MYAISSPSVRQRLMSGFLQTPLDHQMTETLLHRFQRQLITVREHHTCAVVNKNGLKVFLGMRNMRRWRALMVAQQEASETPCRAQRRRRWNTSDSHDGWITESGVLLKESWCDWNSCKDRQTEEDQILIGLKAFQKFLFSTSADWIQLLKRLMSQSFPSAAGLRLGSWNNFHLIHTSCCWNKESLLPSGCLATNWWLKLIFWINRMVADGWMQRNPSVFVSEPLRKV